LTVGERAASVGRSTEGAAVRVPLALLALVALAACGPVQSTAALIDAEVELEAARAAGAPASAPYEFTGAEAYLREAREVAGRARYEDSAAYAATARDLARQARDRAAAGSAARERM
jgi:hypothetical protein